MLSRKLHASPYIISSNGAQGYNYETKETLFYNPVNPKTCLTLYKIAKENNVKFVMNTKEKRVVSKQNEEEHDTLLTEPIEEFLAKNPVMQCLFQDTDFQKIKDLKNKIEEIEGVEIKNQSKSLVNPKITPNQDTYCDIADNVTSKGYAVKKLCEILKIDTKNAIAIRG